MSKEFVDLTGVKFGRLTVESYNGVGKHGWRFWNCICECGKKTIVSGSVLNRGIVKGCGCYSGNKTHGLSQELIYFRWKNMIDRCYNPKADNYSNYGGRNISVCESWRSDIRNFFFDMGNPPTPKHTLDRIDVDKGYFKENCRWATPKEQGRNRRTSRYASFGEQKVTIAEWAEIFGVDWDSVDKHLKKRTMEQTVDFYIKKGYVIIDDGIVKSSRHGANNKA